MNRSLFVARIEGILDDVCGQPDPQARRTLMRQRLDGFLDQLPLELQPIVETRATIVLADIRGFTSIAESLPPRILIEVLNRFFGAMTRVIERHGGLIDKFIGDSVMAVFGAPHLRPDDLLRALACAVEMQQAMVELNRESESRGEPRIYVGIAVNTGQVMAGSFGSRLHREYTVIGEAVNLVSRMEAFSLRGEVLIGETSRAEAGEHIEVGRANQVLVKGLSKPLVLYELRVVNHPQRLVVPRVETRRSPRIQVDFPLLLRQVAGKCILPDILAGRALDLGYNGLRIRLAERLECGTELVTNLALDFGVDSVGDLYARVVRVKPKPGGFDTSLQLSVLDTPAHRQIKKYVDGVLWGR
jgi:adenylate cyclase